MTGWPGARRAGVLALWFVYAAFVLWGTPLVPFHPDESTYLFMSNDFDLLFLQGRPSAVTWTASPASDPVTRYRLLDPSLAHYLPGLGRLLAGYGARPLATDWDWSKTWQANADVGALPEPGLLLAGRLPAALLTALSPLLVFGIGRRLHGPGTGLLAALLYGLNGLVLLHGRRAMSEGPLLFALLLGVWLLLCAPRRPALAGMSAAMALAAKLTGLSLVPVAVVGTVWQQPGPNEPRSRPRLRWAARALGELVLAFGASAALLTPALWAAPLAGLRAMAAARQEFIANQVLLLQKLAPNQVLASPGLRLLAGIYHIFFAPLAFWDVGNYAAQTSAAEARYQALPLHTLLHTSSLQLNLVTGTLLFALALLGLLHAAVLWRQPLSNGTHEQRRAQVLVAVWTLTLALSLLLVPVPWQRYYLPLVAPACLWSARGLAVLLRPVARLVISPARVTRPVP